jgi:hypothetical protein
MTFLESKTTWSGTAGLAAASQVVDKTLGPVISVSDTGTAPRQGRQLHVTRIALRDTVKRSKEIGFSRPKRRRKSPSRAKASKKI